MRRRTRGLILVLLAVSGLVGGLLTPMAAVAVPSAASPKVVPPLISAPLKRVDTHMPKGDFDAPSTARFAKKAAPVVAAAPARFDEGSATVTSMDEYSTTYTDKNGVHRTEVSLSPVNVRSNGKWVKATSDLSDDGASGLIGRLNPLTPRFASNADSSKLFEVSRDGHSISFALKGAARSALQHPVVPLLNIGSNAAHYDGVLPGADLSYVVSTDRVKESLILRRAPKSTNPAYVWTIRAPGLAAVKDRFGDLEFIALDGTVVATMPVPVMWDSSGIDGESQPDITNVDYDVTVASVGVYTLTLRPDAKWLNDPARVYPVILDPTVSPGGNDIHAYKSDGTINNGTVWVGNSHQTSTCCNWRTVLHYNYEQLFGYQIQGAALGAGYLSGTTNCYTGNVYAASAFSYNGAAVFLSSFPVCSTGTASDAGLGARVAALDASNAVGEYWMLTGAECSCYSYKALSTYLSIVYTSFPSVAGVTGSTPTNGARAPVMPIMQGTGNDPAGTGLIYQYAFTSSDGGSAWTTPWAEAGPYQVPQGKLTPGKHYSYTVSVRQKSEWFSQNTTRTASNAAWTFVTNNPAPTPPKAQVVPTDGSVVTSLTPTFSTPTVTDLDSDPVQYQFRVATGADGKSGAVTTSGWMTAPSSGPVTWTPPAGALQDGTAYTLGVMTRDGIDDNWDPTEVIHFTVNLRIGTSGPSPTDTAGPVTVNLANGNANLSFSSPTVATLGGPMGLSFAYNSLIPNDKYRGLTGSYYDALNPGQASTTSFDFTGRTPILSRQDPNIAFDWGTGSPAPQVPADYFLAKWTGFIQVPSTGGPYTFGALADDGVKVIVDGSTVVDRWTTSTGAITWAGGSSSLPAGPVPIEFDYYEGTGSAGATLYVKDASGTQSVVPSDWLTTTYLPLPAGWSASAPLTGSASSYVLAQVTESSVAVTDASGTVHTYTKKSTGGYTAPTGEYGVLALDANGLVTLNAEDGTVYSFNALGKIASVTTPSDAKKPATPIPTYDPVTGRVTKLSDPVSSNGATPPSYSREVLFSYSDGTAGSCPSLTGYTTPIAGMLCRITYPGHTVDDDTTRLYYNTNGQLAQITDPRRRGHDVPLRRERAPERAP